MQPPSPPLSKASDPPNIDDDEEEEDASTEELEALTALREHMESRLEDCGVVIKECDAVLREAKNAAEKGEKKAMIQ